MSNALAAKSNVAPSALEQVFVQGDLSKLSPEARIVYYRTVCDSVGLNPLTKPFEYIVLNEKLVLYARKDATDQLRKIHNVSLTITSRERVGDVYVVTARATLPDGRTDESTGVVPLVKEDGEWKTAQSGKRYFAGNSTYIPLNGDALANALMKAETKSKRRVTLSICGLGLLDETEIETITDAKRPDIAEPETIDHPPVAAEPAKPPPKPLSPATKPAQATPANGHGTAKPASGDSTPKTAADLERRIQQCEDKMVSLGLTQPGDVLAYLKHEGSKRFLDPDFAKWSPKELALGLSLLVRFYRQRESERAMKRVPGRDLDAEADRAMANDMDPYEGEEA